ncbi:MAG: FCD domain-containing protein [Rubrobacter sp.]|jgi:DNA-binding GntR family transcriptional regulator|nr:FCD domain-containing protein [Rubrobacter sp.]MBA3789616.1 FCD domain-containing protein [Rubrobacter sp.]
MATSGQTLRSGTISTAFSLSTRPPGQVLRGLPGQSRIRDEHEAILTAIRRGDVEAAQDKMVAHMNQDVQRGLANFDRIRGV